VADEGWSHVILDDKLFATDRLAETTTSVRGETIDAWYSGKHRDFGANIQAIVHPDGLPIWTSDAAPGHLHDLTCAHLHDIPGALYWAASQLNLPTLADSGYDGTGQGIHTPHRQPADGARLGPRQPRLQHTAAVNALPRGTRASPCSPAAGAAYGTPPPARGPSATSSAPPSCSPISNTATYRIPARARSCQWGLDA
jgi:hypothetical protein